MNISDVMTGITGWTETAKEAGEASDSTYADFENFIMPLNIDLKVTCLRSMKHAIKEMPEKGAGTKGDSLIHRFFEAHPDVKSDVAETIKKGIGFTENK